MSAQEMIGLARMEGSLVDGFRPNVMEIEDQVDDAQRRRIQETRDLFMKSSRYYFGMSRLSETDADLAFYDMVKAEENIKKSNAGNFHVKASGAETLQAMAFEKIHGGMKKRLLSSGILESQGERFTDDQIKGIVKWISDDIDLQMAEKDAETATILKSISKRLDTDDFVAQEYEYVKLLVEVYIQQILKDVLTSGGKVKVDQIMAALRSAFQLDAR